MVECCQELENWFGGANDDVISDVWPRYATSVEWFPQTCEELGEVGDQNPRPVQTF